MVKTASNIKAIILLTTIFELVLSGILKAPRELCRIRRLWSKDVQSKSKGWWWQTLLVRCSVQKKESVKASV